MPQDHANLPNNLRIWRQVETTDPRHTKAVEYGRKFTSIDAHWQIMRATETFGPVGFGWGYEVKHSIERLTDTMILAVADVTVWWHTPDTFRASYGPIRGTCEVYGPKTYKGKVIPGEFVTDEDAPKKAMTDALTKGLSHLGFSADVFLGKFDDNRYVQRVAREFETAVERVAPEDRGLIKDGETRSQYQVNRDKTAPDREAAKIAKVKGWNDEAIKTMKLSGQTVESLGAFWKSGAKQIEWMENNLPAEHTRFVAAYDDALDAAKVRVGA